jgi:hypothetical protein
MSRHAWTTLSVASAWPEVSGIVAVVDPVLAVGRTVGTNKFVLAVGLIDDGQGLGQCSQGNSRVVGRIRKGRVGKELQMDPMLASSNLWRSSPESRL